MNPVLFFLFYFYRGVCSLISLKYQLDRYAIKALYKLLNVLFSLQLFVVTYFYQTLTHCI